MRIEEELVLSAASELQRLRNEANKCRLDIARASAVVAAKRKKAADASSAASRSKSATTVRMKLSEAERSSKEANDAEKKRGQLEKRLADLELKIAKAQARYEQEQRDSQKKALSALRRDMNQSSAQFQVPPPDRRITSPQWVAQTAVEPTDVFLSHASEDKDDIARPLKDALEARGLSVWFDEIQIKLGQSIRQEIERGIANCRFGVVILSPSFLQKQWTQAELDAMFNRKMDTGENLILPIWHHVSKDEVLTASPLLAGILALNSSLQTIEEMADAIHGVVRA